MFQIELDPEAREDLRCFRKNERVRIQDEMEAQLLHQPAVPTRKRKHLRPGHLSEWELRLGTVRVFYDVDVAASLVKIMAVGYKERDRLFFRGKEYPYEAHDD